MVKCILPWILRSYYVLFPLTLVFFCMCAVFVLGPQWCLGITLSCAWGFGVGCVQSKHLNPSPIPSAQLNISSHYTPYHIVLST